MSVKDFQTFITSDPQLQSFGCVGGQVNLLELDGDAGSKRKGRGGQMVQNRVALVMDGEQCLDRLYGGYFPDWSCGGQWRNTMAYLSTLFGRMHQANLHLAIFFNGAIEPSRFKEWRHRQGQIKSHVKQVLRHLSRRMTPPPKAFWVPPCGIHSMLRLALRSMNLPVLSSLEDHYHEVMAFCWDNGYHGVLSDDGEYAMFNPPRFFSAHNIKLSFQHDLLTLEFNLDEVAKSLDLNPNRFSLLGALLGNHILTPHDLCDFHERIVPELKLAKAKDKSYKVGFDRVIRAVVNYIRTIQSAEDLEAIATDVFGSPKDPRLRKLREAIKYYFNGSKEGYLKQKPKKAKKGDRKKRDCIKLASEEEEEAAEKKKMMAATTSTTTTTTKDAHTDLVERIALDLDQLDLAEAVEKVKQQLDQSEEHKCESNDDEDEDDDDDDEDDVIVEGSEEASMSVVQALASGVEVAPSEGGKYPVNKEKEGGDKVVKPINIPEPPNDVRRTAVDRHRQGQMSPLVYQLLTRGEIKLPVLLENEQSEDIPLVHHFYQPLRRNVYAILYNKHHARFNRRQVEDHVKGMRRKASELNRQAKSAAITEEERKEMHEKADLLMKQAADTKLMPAPDYTVREWLPYDNYEKPEAVEAVELPWAVPTVQRLWFGSAVEDKQKRLRCFLTCLHCDEVKPLLVQSSVPQHVLLMACVLRYMMTASKFPVLRKPELDAFLATAFSPELADVNYLADMKLEMVTIRGVQLATLFMQGIEMAILANDACGAPIPLGLCLPWTFFDGKLFHAKLLKATSARNLMELCDGRMEIVCQVERTRAAILHGLVPPTPSQATMGPVGRGRGVPMGGRVGGGGQLIVGGAVVGQWGDGQQHPMPLRQPFKNGAQKKRNKNKGSAAKKKSAATAKQQSVDKNDESVEEEDHNILQRDNEAASPINGEVEE